MSLEKKRSFVELTYEILKNEGVEGVKIRRIAKELGCTSTVIYRYFENIDHLIILASVKFLNEYILDFKELVTDTSSSDPLELNLKMWNCLAKHAFNHVPIYENLFFGNYKESLGDRIFEYYQMYLENDKQDFDGYSASIMFNDDLFQRDYVLLRRAASLGIITIADAKTLSELDCYTFHGMLMRYMDSYKEPGVAQKATEEFSFLVHELANKYRQKKQPN